MDEIKIADYIILKDRNYLPTHEWCQEQKDGTWLIGISDYAQKMLREISYVQFEEVGEEFQQEEILAVVEALKATGDIYAPFDCELIENNTILENKPEKVTDSPYKEGWLVKVKPKSDDMSNLISAEEYSNVVKNELEDL